jgi:peroxiredoxin
VLLAVSLSACGGVAASNRGPTAADFTLPGIDGRQVHLGTHLARRQVVLLSFWTSCCHGGRAALPFLEELHRRHHRRGLTVLAISMDGPDSESQVRPTVRRYGLSFAVLLDRDTRVVAQLNPRRANPHFVLIGRDGRIAYQREGFVQRDRDELRSQVERALAVRR